MKRSFISHSLVWIGMVISSVLSLASCAQQPPYSSESWHEYLNQYAEDRLPQHNNWFIDQAKPFVEQDVPTYLEIQSPSCAHHPVPFLCRVALHDEQWQLYHRIVTDQQLSLSFIAHYHNEQVFRLHFSSKDAQDAFDLRRKILRLYTEVLKQVQKRWVKHPMCSVKDCTVPDVAAQKRWSGWGHTPLQAHWAANIQRWRAHQSRVHHQNTVSPLGFKEAVFDLLAVMQRLAQTPTQALNPSEAEVIRFPDMMKRPLRVPLEQSVHGMVVMDVSTLQEDQLKAQIDVLHHTPVHTITFENLPKLIAKMKHRTAHIQSRFHRAERLFVQAVRDLDVQNTVIYFSGYRGFFFPTRPWTLKQKTQLLLRLRHHSLPPYHILFLNPPEHKLSGLKRVAFRVKQQDLAWSTFATLRACDSLNQNSSLDIDTDGAHLFLWHPETKQCTQPTALLIRKKTVLPST